VLLFALGTDAPTGEAVSGSGGAPAAADAP